MTAPMLSIEHAGPAVTVQDLGRPGHLAAGLSRGGAADILGLLEGAALLGRPPGDAAIEMAGFGGRFVFDAATAFALTGAPMRASCDGAALAWNMVHKAARGAVLEIGPCLSGQYGYLNLGGGIATEPRLGARAVHTRAGIGRALAAGDTLPLGPDSTDPDRIGLALPDEDRFAGGLLRVLPSAQTGLFDPEVLARFETTAFTRAPRGSRLGVALSPEGGASFALEGGQGLLSEITCPGDIQITGDGTPFLLLADCQTTGGYPRLACVLPQDLSRAAQAGPGASLRFRFIDPGEALDLHRRWRRDLARLPALCRPALRDPAEIPDLLGAQLISGVTRGDPEI